MVTRDRQHNVPSFASVEEAAAFWDRHDFTEFGDEPEPAEVEVARPLEHIISVRLESEDFRRLAAAARQHDVNMVALARRWVLEALDRTEAEVGSSPECPAAPA